MAAAPLIPDVFVSYKSGDRAMAGVIMQALQAEGLNVWWDQHIGVGDEWRQSITDNLHAARCVLVVWTKLSAGPEGRFVQDEASRALRLGRYLGVRLESVDMPLGFGGLQTVDLKSWKGDRTDPKFRVLVAAVASIHEGKTRQRPDPQPMPGTPQIGRRWLIGGAAAGVVAAAAAATLGFSRNARCAIGLCGASGGDASSIAVLPFHTIGNGREVGYVADGLTEELRGALARLASIHVAARASTNALSAKGLDLKDIAGQLNVSHVLDGSVQGADGKLRVNTALVRIDDGFEEWSQSFDRPATDLLALQTDIATSVAQTLRGRLDAQESASVGRKPTENPQAFDAYLRGRKLLDLSADQDSDRSALAMFDMAIALDAGFAAAHAARARALQSLAIAAPDAGAVREYSDRALASAREAAKLAPDLPEVESTLGFVLQTGQLDFPGAAKLYLRSLDQAPNDSDILIRYGLLSIRMGRTAVGMDALRKATRLDPVNPRAFRALGLGCYGARDWKGAIAAMRQALALAPSVSAAHATIGDALLRQGDIKGAIAEYGQEPQDFTRETGLAIALRKAGDNAGSDAAFKRLVASGDAVSYQEAQVLAEWGRADDAISKLDRALTLRDSGLVYLLTDPAFDRLRKDKRFVAVLTRLSLG
jgi:TolB-like protein/Tfp pilus assembly protein PilF